MKNKLPANILMVTSYPPRECGIATYSLDLLTALKNKFAASLSIRICALESGEMNLTYPEEVIYVLDTDNGPAFGELAGKINKDSRLDMVMIQHEFGFYKNCESEFIQFLKQVEKEIVIAFHTVLPGPSETLRSYVNDIAGACDSIVVMTKNSARILVETYSIPREKITVIAHGTHLIPNLGKRFLKNKYNFKGRKILTTFGLLSSGKGIETTLDALPAIIKEFPEVLFLIIGKTHPEVVKSEGEVYRESLATKVILNKLSDNVEFINNYLELKYLLEYLQLTDIYLFTSNDPNQAVSGTFVYAMSCGCPIISTPIPHARELLTEDLGNIFDFGRSDQLADAVIRLLGNDPLRRSIGTNTLQKIISTAWENSAVEHAMLFRKVSGDRVSLSFDLPPVKLDHLSKMTTHTGIIQFSRISQPDRNSGYTLDDNARALIACSMYYHIKPDKELIPYIRKYLGFIKYCQQPGGDFLNYVHKDNSFTAQNATVNLDDAHGRAIWALGYLISLKDSLPGDVISTAEAIIEKSLFHIEHIHSTRAMAFIIKGLYHLQETAPKENILLLITTLANRLIQMYRHESNENWEWFEGYLTYANSVLPEAILYAWLITKNQDFKDLAIKSLDFLLSHTFNQNGIEVISNKNWYRRGEKAGQAGEQPIDVAYTVMTLSKFYEAFGDEEYRLKMIIAFNWFLGSNRLHQIVYNPCTGGCFDGLEENNINLNQGAESTISYLIARLTMWKYDV